MAHAFGDLLSRLLHRKHGLSQSKLAAGINQSPSVITAMCQGQRLKGAQARERVLMIIDWLNTQGALTTLADANALLAAAGMANLTPDNRDEAALHAKLQSPQSAASNSADSSVQELLTNLPPQRTSFIGREWEIGEVLHLFLVEQLRCVTLTGAGGCGKTRLALEIATRMNEQYSGGIWLLELANIHDPEQIVQALALILNVRKEPSRSLLDTVIASISNKPMLLLLDNCEHLVDACARFTDLLLHQCSQIRILATSREPLQIPGEAEWPVPPLTLPERVDLYDARLLQKYEAVRLFRDRALAVQPGFAITSQNAAAVADICRQLEGLPLAIELAAVRIRGLTVDQIAQRLTKRLQLLTSGNRAASPRQTTLRATIDWSYALLTEAERTLLRRLSVFAGSWTLEAAEVLCVGKGIEASHIIELLLSLIQKSLVRVGGREDAPRYAFLETIRQYADEKLREVGEHELLSQHHAFWYLQLAQREETAFLAYTDIAGAIARLDDDYENIRAALAWSRDSMPELGLQLASALGKYWLYRGQWDEGRSWIETFLDMDIAGQDRARAKALWVAGAIAGEQGEPERASRYLQECMSLARANGEAHTLADALISYALLVMNPEDYTTTITYLEESLALSREAQYSFGIASALSLLGSFAFAGGNFEKARILLEASVHESRANGNSMLTSGTLYFLAGLALLQDQHREARSYLEECMSLVGSGSAAPMQLYAAELYARVEMLEGNFEEAHGLLTRNLETLSTLRNRGWIVHALEACAALALAQHQPERAVKLLAAADTLNSRIGGALMPIEQALFEKTRASAQAQIDDAQYKAIWNTGITMTMEQAVAYALQR